MPLLDLYTGEGGLAYLTDRGVEPPTTAPALGRFPTPRELVAVLTGLEGYKAEVQPGDRSVDIQLDRPDGEWTFVCTLPHDRDDEPCQFYFQSGSVLCARDVLRALVPTCGPFVLIENDEEPEIVDQG